MCGIFGLMSFSPEFPVDRGLLSRMGGLMTHRGPDDEGTYVDTEIAIGMRRLSIIDVSGGHQPISNEDGSIWVVCNGEIYNFQELRKELIARGHVFKCSSDTEILVHLYEVYGDGMVQRLRGMFGFALWDGRQRRLVVGRDRLGIKPLYFSHNSKRLIVASEIKSLLADPSFPRRVDPVALSDYLSWGYVTAPRTLFEGIQKLLPGHLLIVEDSQVRTESYWDVPVNCAEKRSEDEWIQGIRDKLTETVKSHLISDVPLGAFLSGGLDSSAIVCLMAKLMDRPVKTFSIGFDEEVYNELPYAKVVAEAFGTEHHEIMVRPDVFDLLPKLIWHLDEPIADSAFITTYLVSEFARQSVTVILSGVGGDELFGGYRRYLGSEISRHYNRLPGFLRQGLIPRLMRLLPVDRNSNLRNYFRLARAFVGSNHLSPESRYLQYLSVFSRDSQSDLLCREVREQVDRRGKVCGLEQLISQSPVKEIKELMMVLDLKTQLPDDLLYLTDKMTMAASLECRVPFLDHEFVEFAARIPSCLKIRNLQMKYILKKALEPLLPARILHRKKRGFGAPVGFWIRGALRALSLDVLSPANVARRGFFEWSSIKRTLDSHFSEQEDHTDHLLALINFELWCRIYLDGEGAAAALTKTA